MQRDKGKRGEFLIWKKLKNLEDDGARFLFNLYLPRDRGKTTEIDVLLIAPQGLFVFESKNYSGWIFGNEQSRYWMQTLPSGRGKSNKERFLNPIMQNSLHIRCLKSIIGNDIPVQSVIVFSDRCELKRLEVNMQGAIQVVKLEYLPNIVTRINWGTQMSKQQIDALFDQLYEYSQVSEDVKKKHIADIQERLREPETHPVTVVSETEKRQNANENDPSRATRAVTASSEDSAQTTSKSSESPICPRCGGKLVMRTVKQGENAGKQFYGCSNYPKCRFTKSL